MGVPLSTPTRESRESNFKLEGLAGRSVFEDSIDTIAPTEGKVLGKDDARWKFKGPWLAGLTEGNFNAYVVKEVRKRKVEFREFLRSSCAVETTQDQRQRATDEADEIPLPLEAKDITDKQLTEYIKVLRRDRIKLNQHIRSFLDLPPSPSIKIGSEMSDSFESIFIQVQEEIQSTSNSPYAESGPPKTHPSAGLSYSRTASHTFNHPLYGPQKYPPPVQARVVMPKAAATGNFAPVLGVGGFTVNVPAGEIEAFHVRPKGNMTAQIPGLAKVDPDAVGGSKTWVHPKSARIDSKGRILLNVIKADPEAIAVKEGKVGDIPTQFKAPSRPFYASSSTGTSPYGGGYGLRPEDFSRRKAEQKRMERDDIDALQELKDFVTRDEK
jgi:hypothetical protein